MSQVYTLCEIAENNGKNGNPVWLIVKGAVYDMSKFLKEHPGGDDAIMEYAGKDATKAFNDVGHSTDAIKEMKLYKIGVVSNECINACTSTKPAAEIITSNQQLSQPSVDIECRRTQKKRIKLFFCF